jgi:uncharacterized protein
MRIGCVSDTHLMGRPLPDWVLEAFEGADLILHAGDILEMAVIEQLSAVAETRAVRGNMDHGAVARELPDRLTVQAGDFKIGLTHGHGPPSGITWKVAKVFEGQGCDCIVFGHTHNSLVKERNGMLFFNPGSPTDRMFARHNTVGILEVTDKIEPLIIDVRKGEKRP